VKLGPLACKCFVYIAPLLHIGFLAGSLLEGQQRKRSLDNAIKDSLHDEKFKGSISAFLQNSS